jgi:hypothetical protein
LDEFARSQAVSREIERVRNARISPMRLPLPAFTSLIVAALSPGWLVLGQVLNWLELGAV